KGTVDYHSDGLQAGVVGSGSLPLANRAAVNTAAAGQIDDLGSGNYRLTVPVVVSITSDVGTGGTVTGTLTFRAQGMLVASASVPQSRHRPDGFNCGPQRRDHPASC